VIAGLGSAVWPHAGQYSKGAWPLDGHKSSRARSGTWATWLLGAGPQQHHRTGGHVDVLRSQCAVNILDRDLIGGWQGLDVLQARDVEEHAAGDNRRNRCHVRLAEAEIAAPFVRGEAVVELVLRLVRDVAEPPSICVATLSFMVK